MTRLPLTLVTTCKPFIGETSIHQRVAIQSWKKLGLDIVLIGDDLGTKEASAEFNCRHVPDVECSVRGIPLLNSLFETALAHTDTAFVAYINADIILCEDFLEGTLAFTEHFSDGEPCLLTTRRKNIPILSGSVSGDWTEDEIAELIKHFGAWDLSDAIDLFLFNRSLYKEVPPFEIGRMQWDNWLLAEAANRGAAIVDGSLSFALLHPIHDYDVGWRDVVAGEGTFANRRLADGQGLDINGARSHVIKNNNICKLDREISYELSSYVQECPHRELAGCLYVLRNMDDATSSECADGLLRRFLWRRHIYFPINVDASEPTSLLSHINDLIDQVNQGHYSQVIEYLQNYICAPFLRILKPLIENGRPIIVWGTGGFAREALMFLKRHNIPVSSLAETSPSKNEALGYLVLNPTQIENLSERPFIIIASMYIAEISEILETYGYREVLDYTH